MKIIKKLILSTLLVVTFSGRADDNIEDKLTCAADAITIHSSLFFTSLHANQHHFYQNYMCTRIL
jgi:hypothetical protein